MLSGKITHKSLSSPHGRSSEQLSLSLAPLLADTIPVVTSSGTYSLPIQTCKHVALRPQKQGCLLGTGTGTGTGGGRGRESEGLTARTDPEDRGGRGPRPEQWRLRRCPLAIAQQLVHYVIADSTAVLGRDTRTKSVAPLLSNNFKQKRSSFHSLAPPHCS